jgi:hypothetical protein
VLGGDDVVVLLRSDIAHLDDAQRAILRRARRCLLGYERPQRVRRRRLLRGQGLAK